MANTQGLATSFKTEILAGVHALGTTVVRTTTAPDVIKAALYLASATLGPSTTVYSPTGEVSGNNYTAGGVVVVDTVAPASNGTTAYWTPTASFVYTNVTLQTSFDTVLLYNSSQGNRAISVHTFGAQTITNGTFALTMPSNDANNALIRLA